MLVIFLLLGIKISIAQEIPLPRPVIEWCLECQSTVTILYKVIDNRDSANKSLKAKIESDQRVINNYKEKEKEHENEKDALREQVVLGDKKNDQKDKEIRKLKTNKWLERILFGAGIVITAIVTKEVVD